MLVRDRAAHEQQAVDLLLQQRVDDTNFLVLALVRITQNDIVVIHVGDVFDSSCDFREICVRDVGNDDANCRRLLASETARNGIRPITESLYRFVNFLSRLWLDVRLLLTTRDTVAIDTPASRATS